MKYWFTSDYHLGHENIIKYCNRPFKSLEQMNNTIIRNHNSRVKKDDIVFHIGDFCFKNTSKKGEGTRISAYQWEQKLNGKIIHIKGNHDKNNSTKTIIDSASITYGGEYIYLIHNPIDAQYQYSYNFVGHVHNKFKFKIIDELFPIYIVNVGVDVWNFMPITLDEIKKEFKKYENKINKTL